MHLPNTQAASLGITKRISYAPHYDAERDHAVGHHMEAYLTFVPGKPITFKCVPAWYLVPLSRIYYRSRFPDITQATPGLESQVARLE